MFVPPKKQAEPVSQKYETAVATKRQTRSVTAEARRLDEDLRDRDKELNYYLGLKVSTSRVEGLSTPSARAQHAKDVRERVPTSLAKLEEIIRTTGKEGKPDLRTEEEVMHDFAVIEAQSRTFK